MKLHSKLTDVSKMGLVAALDLLTTANVQAGDIDEAGPQFRKSKRAMNTKSDVLQNLKETQS